jgi:hypothetical protein
MKGELTVESIDTRTGKPYMRWTGSVEACHEFLTRMKNGFEFEEYVKTVGLELDKYPKGEDE